MQTAAPLWALAWDEQDGVRTLNTVEEIRSEFGRPDSRLWIDLEDPDRVLLVELCGVLQLHPLVTEDIMERTGSPGTRWIWSWVVVFY
jgi:Mg2+ and Co2+ transporter CorA